MISPEDIYEQIELIRSCIKNDNRLHIESDLDKLKEMIDDYIYLDEWIVQNILNKENNND